MERDPRDRRPYDYSRDDEYAHLLGVRLAPGSMPIPHRAHRRIGGRPIAPPGQMVYYRRRRGLRPN